MHIHTWVTHTLTHTHIWLWSRLFSVAVPGGRDHGRWSTEGVLAISSKASPHWHTSLHSDLSWTSERQPCLATLSPSQTLNFFASSLHFLYFLKYFIKAFQKKSTWQPRKEPLLKDYLTFLLSTFKILAHPCYLVYTLPFTPEPTQSSFSPQLPMEVAGNDYYQIA